jgi:hypothetical protein
MLALHGDHWNEAAGAEWGQTRSGWNEVSQASAQASHCQ